MTGAQNQALIPVRNWPNMDLEIPTRQADELEAVAEPKLTSHRRIGQNVAILGTAHALPKKVIGNDVFTANGAVSDEWIMARTGIRERRQAGPDEHASILGTQAALAAMEQAGVGALDLDAIICTTVTPEMWIVIFNQLTAFPYCRKRKSLPWRSNSKRRIIWMQPVS